ncbi:MAG: MMPL family transporter, partial [Micrococcus sp.]|nr:MMPL family transporter [Micrococcus sp.]
AELDAGQAQLDAAREQALAQAAAAGAPTEAVEEQFAPQQAQLDAGREQLEAGRAELETQQAQLDAAREELESGQQQLADGEEQIATNEAALDRGERTAALAQDFRSVSEDGAVAIGVVTFTVPGLDVESDDREAVADLLTEADIAGVEVYPTQDLTQSVPDIVGPAEIVGLVVAAITLLIMLGTFAAAGLPLLNALIGVGVGVSAALAFSGTMEMMSVTPVLGIMLGLAVGIDYALFIVNRHRQQLKTGMEVRESIGLANGTSGNAVVFAGLTVIIALVALNITGIPFLGMMGTVGAVCVGIAVLVATTLTPALLSLIGRRALSKKERARLDAGERAVLHAAPAQRADGRYETLSTRRSIAVALLAAIALAIVAIPFASMRLGLPDGGAEPVGSDAQVSYTLTEEAFGAGYNGPLVVTADLPSGLDETAAQDLQLDVAEQLREFDDVAAVVPAALNDDNTIAMMQVIPVDGPNSVSTEELVHQLRDTQPVGDATALDVAGMTSGFIDVSQTLSDALPLYLSVVVGLSLIIMVVVFRSLLVPLIATGGFVLSVFAAMGAVVAIYQWGWLSWLFGVTQPGPVLSFLPTIMIGVLFGLAMDYQLFIATGMREAYAHGTPARAAVLSGLRAGRSVVIAAAIIMISVFGGFIFSHDTMIRPIGFGLAMGVLLDAFVVRLLLMPAIMHLLGPAAWWMPRWLDRILPDVDVEGSKLERAHGVGGEETAETTAAPGGGRS